MIEPVDDPIRCTPRSRTAEIRPAYFHGQNTVTSVLALISTPVLVGYLFLVEFSPFVAVGGLISLFFCYLVLFALPFDHARVSRPQVWTLTPQSITRTVPGATTTVDWTQFRCLVIGRRALLLHARNGATCLVLPRRCLTATELSRLVEWTRAQQITVRRSRLSLWSSPADRPAALTGT